MSEAPPKAVFLSYASQDTEAARHICEALRASGVEVWFDVEGGLETGDEWDAKIRRQIKECVLFLPLISANTQAREEGYFRIEWDLAAERARGIASGVPFILPIVIDDTREPDALVPDRFRAVQWTRARDGGLSPATQAKFAKLWSHRVGLARHKAGDAPAVAAAAENVPAASSEAPAAVSRKLSPAVLALSLLLVAGLGAAIWFFASRPKPMAPSEPAVIAATSPARADEFPRDPDLKRARALLFSMDAIPEDFVLAEDIIKPIVAQRPNDPEVATIAAEVSLEFIVRGFDLTPARRSQIQRQTERAAQLAPDNPYALATLGRYLLFNDAQLARAEGLLRRAIALRPDEPRFHRALYSVLSVTKPAAEADAYGERMAAQFPNDALVAYDIARRFKDANDLVQAEKWFDRCVTHEQPPSFAFVWKAWIEIWVHGNLPAAKQWLDRVPDRQRANSRVASARYLHALLSGETGHAMRALNEMADDWLSDFDYTGPKALLTGNLQLQRGNNDVARVLLESALASVSSEADKTPTDLRLQRAKMWVLLSLGRMEEARAIQRVLLQATRRPYQLTLRSVGWGNQVVSCLLLGLREDAVAQLREACADPNSRPVIRNLFKLDPRLAPWRADAEITAILAEPAVGGTPAETAPGARAAAPANDKSVAVLAFANLSDDKANEHFSDGISEELLNVLAKVPGLKVSARTSAFFFKGKSTPIPEIAQQLGVAYVVEGSVRKAGDKVRITAQLIKAADGFHVWSDTFTRDLKDVFAVQDEIAGLIAQNLSLRMGVASSPTSLDAEVLPLYYSALQAWNLRSLEGMDRAEALLNDALRRSPQFARGHAALAAVWLIRGEIQDTISPFGLRSSPLARKIVAKLEEALRLDPNCAEAFAVRGAFGWDTWGWEQALADLRRATELNPNFASAYQWMGRVLASQGRLAEAIPALQRAAELDPLSPRILDNYGRMLLFAGRAREALEQAERALALQPSAVQARGLKANALLVLGQHAAAAELARTLPTEMPIVSVYKVIVLAEAGHPAELEEMLPHFTPGGHISRIAALAALGRREEALSALDADWITATRADMLLHSPVLDPLRDDPRFARTLQALGLTEAHQRAQAFRSAKP